MKPIVPTKATAPAVSKELIKNTCNLTLSVSIPKLYALSSPADNAVNFQA